MKATEEEVLSRIPGSVTTEWPMGKPFAAALAHGTMSVGYYAPIGHNPQTPHKQDEIYFIHRGPGTWSSMASAIRSGRAIACL